jgi:segregation and condensation protein B
MEPVSEPTTDPSDEGQQVLDVDALPSGARGAVEAVLMVVEEPVSEVALASALAVPVDRVKIVLGDLAREYDRDGRGFELRHVAGGWRIYSRPEYAPVVERFLLEGQTAKLTQAALETLAIVAYRQPLTRAAAEAIRGVNCEAVLDSLERRGLIAEVGRQDTPGHPRLFGTTMRFLQVVGLERIEDLPPLPQGLVVPQPPDLPAADWDVDAAEEPPPAEPGDIEVRGLAADPDEGYGDGDAPDGDDAER